jgi:signal peptidase I
MWNKCNKNISELNTSGSAPLPCEEGSWERSKPKRILLSVLGWFLFLILAIILAVAIRVFLLASFVILTWSMYPTLILGDFVFVNKMIPGPLYIPDENDTVAINTMNIRLYRKLIEYETQELVDVKDGQVFIANKPVDKYIFQQNYYLWQATT